MKEVQSAKKIKEEERRLKDELNKIREDERREKEKELLDFETKIND